MLRKTQVYGIIIPRNEFNTRRITEYMSASNNWYVITGGPSTGKTTLLAEFEKLGHATIPEAARMLIDGAIAKGATIEELRADENRFQTDIFRFKHKLDAGYATDVLTFLDRGLQDSLAYMRYYDIKVEQWIEDIMHATRYKKVFLLDPLAAYHQDYARIESEDFVHKITNLLHEVYTKYGMQPVRVPAASVSDRVQFIVDNM